MSRPTKGVEHVESLAGDETAKRRLRAVLRTIAGDLAVEEACRELSISPARFHELREEALEGALRALEPKPAGRPPAPEPDPELAALRKKNADLERDLEAAHIRTEIAIVMPHLLKPPQGRRKKGISRREERHVREALALFEAVRGTQRDRRLAERRVRFRVVAWTRAYGAIPREEQARALHLSSRTLRDWHDQWATDRLSPSSRGRPTKEASRSDRVKMLGLLWLYGPRTGWERLRAHFPGAGRREVRRILKATRRLWTRLDRVGALALSWTKPGAVWAMDFAQPPTPIEGRYQRILLVRDLASGATLLALPCEDETAQTAVAAMKSLFLEFGAPLVLKADNGSAFIAQAMKDLAYAFGVTLLYSPPHYPAYNGACEAGVGSIKARAHHLAARAGRAGRWTLDDVEGARLLSNEVGRPFGASCPAPRDGWNLRRPIGDAARDLFLEDVARNFDTERSRRGFTQSEPDPVELASIDRAAISRTLEEHGLLTFKTRPVSPPIPSLISAIIS
jgi:transposase InsO family protein